MGAKGINVCEEWDRNYLAFKNWALENGYDDQLPRGIQTIERKDAKRGYSPDNCEWKTIQQQQRNKANTRLFEYNGESHTISEWSEITGIKHSVLHARIYYGWDIKDAIEREIGKTHGKNYIYIKYKGEEKSLIQISKESGVLYSTLVRAYKKGDDIEEVIKKYYNNGKTFVKKYEFEGKTLTVSEWSQYLGVPTGTLQYRIAQGKPYDEIFTTQKYIGLAKSRKKAED